jgi:uncharacterized ferritin-like protein (DUF455 family)
MRQPFKILGKQYGKPVLNDSVFSCARNCLALTSVDEKLKQTASLQRQWLSGSLGVTGSAVAIHAKPGMPGDLNFVAPAKLPRRSLHNSRGHAAFIHALTHIEFTAINLALDIIIRFQDMPRLFYDNWVRVAAEEAMHFEMLRGRLKSLDYDYGDFPVHNGLWETAEKTAHDILIRLALVPRMLEARGLDVTPAMINRLLEIQDKQTAKILEKILADEIGHVSIGSHWFNYVCNERGLDSHATFINIIKTHAGSQIRKPINFKARRAAGFSELELSGIETMTK